MFSVATGGYPIPYGRLRDSPYKWALVVFTGIAVLTLVESGVGTAMALGFQVPYGLSTPDGSYVQPYYQALFYTPSIYPGQLVYGDQIFLLFINPHGNRSVNITVNQTASGQTPLVTNLTVFVATGTNIIGLNLSSSSVIRNAEVCIDRGCFNFPHQTPITLLPAGVLDIGGIDLLSFGLIIEFAGAMAIFTVLARWVSRKVLWSPKVNIIIVVPHIALGTALLLSTDIQALDAFFGGAEFLIIPIVSSFLWFWWYLHFFNKADSAVAVQPDPQQGHSLEVFWYDLWLGWTEFGKLVVIGSRWRDWWYRLFGHFPVLWERGLDPEKIPRPAFANVKVVDIEARRLPTRRTIERLDKLFKARPGRDNPYQQFRVHKAAGSPMVDTRRGDPPRFFFLVDTDVPFNVRMPYLSIHKVVTLPSWSDVNGTYHPPEQVVKLCWPHVVDPPATGWLAGIHMIDEVAAAVLLPMIEELTKQKEILQIQNHALRVSIIRATTEGGARAANAVTELLRRQRESLSDAEINEETRQAGAAPQEPTERPQEEETPARFRVTRGQVSRAGRGLPG